MPTIAELVEQATQHQHIVDFGPFKLAVNVSDGSGATYRDDARRDEFADPLTRDLIARLKPQMFLDLGANFGFMSMMHHHLNPQAAIVAVEMSPLVTPFIRKTFELNGVTRATVLDAAAGSTPGRMKSRLNVLGSADNRVVPAAADRFLSRDWYEVSVVTIDQLLAEVPPTVPVMIKIDTQGYERHVFAGGATSLARSRAWAIKTEFGPWWLKSQSTDPTAFLSELVDAYDVCEWPLRARFKGDTIERLLESRLTVADVAPFVEWLASHTSHGRGWCDLLVAPKDRSW